MGVETKSDTPNILLVWHVFGAYKDYVLPKDFSVDILANMKPKLELTQAIRIANPLVLLPRSGTV